MNLSQQQQPSHPMISISRSCTDFPPSSATQRRPQVCLFGLSADPPTGIGGHWGIAQYLATSSALSFDEVRILPVYRHMYSTKRNNQTPFHHRVQMCKLLFENGNNNSNHNKVVVSEAERICFERHSQAAGRSLEDDPIILPNIKIGTADILDMLTTHEPNVDFTLALGSDTFIDLASGKWKRTEDVFTLIGHRIVVFRRKRRRKTASTGIVNVGGGNETNHASAIPMSVEDAASLDEDDEKLLHDLVAKWQIINPSTQSSSIQTVTIPTLTNVSSSAVRQSTDVEALKEMISESVLDYIRQHNLYSFVETKEERR